MRYCLITDRGVKQQRAVALLNRGGCGHCKYRTESYLHWWLFGSFVPFYSISLSQLVFATATALMHFKRFLLLETGESVWRKDAGRGRCSHRERRWGGVFARFHISQHLQPPCDGVFFIWKITTCEVRESDLFTIMIEPILLDNYHLNILYCKVLSSALPSIKNKTSCSADNITYKANYLMFIGTVLNSVGLIFFKMQYIHTLNITGYLHFKVIYYLQDYCLCNVWLITQLFCYLKKPK